MNAMTPTTYEALAATEAGTLARLLKDIYERRAVTAAQTLERAEPGTLTAAHATAEVALFTALAKALTNLECAALNLSRDAEPRPAPCDVCGKPGHFWGGMAVCSDHLPQALRRMAWPGLKP